MKVFWVESNGSGRLLRPGFEGLRLCTCYAYFSNCLEIGMWQRQPRKRKREVLEEEASTDEEVTKDEPGDLEVGEFSLRERDADSALYPNTHSRTHICCSVCV